MAIMGSLYFLNPDGVCGETGSFGGGGDGKNTGGDGGDRGAGMLVAHTVKQSVVQVPAGETRSFRRMTGQVLLSFHT